MKLLIFILFPLITSAQCPPGQVFLPTVTVGSQTWVSNRCVPQSEYDSIWNEVKKATCAAQVLTVTNVTPSYEHSTGYVFQNGECVRVEIFQKKVSGEWLEISRCVYYWDNRTRFYCNKPGTSPTLCCGHEHTSKPL